MTPPNKGIFSRALWFVTENEKHKYKKTKKKFALTVITLENTIPLTKTHYIYYRYLAFLNIYNS